MAAMKERVDILKRSEYFPCKDKPSEGCSLFKGGGLVPRSFTAIQVTITIPVKFAGDFFSSSVWLSVWATHIKERESSS